MRCGVKSRVEVESARQGAAAVLRGLNSGCAAGLQVGCRYVHRAPAHSFGRSRDCEPGASERSVIRPVRQLGYTPTGTPHPDWMRAKYHRKVQPRWTRSLDRRPKSRSNEKCTKDEVGANAQDDRYHYREKQHGSDVHDGGVFRAVTGTRQWQPGAG